MAIDNSSLCLLVLFIGTKHIDPDSGLIYFKYDFGYEFGIILPGEGKSVDTLPSVADGQDGVPFPVTHTKSATSADTPKDKGYLHFLLRVKSRSLGRC